MPEQENWNYTAQQALVSYTDFVAAIKDVVFKILLLLHQNTKNFSISIGQANYLPSNGHFTSLFQA
jgi:hypothetical protein